MNHKRHRAKNRRAGCLFCKPHKQNGAGKQALTVQDLRAPTVVDELIAYADSVVEDGDCFKGPGIDW